MIADMLFLGVDWADPDQPQVRMAPADGGASILSRWDEVLRYRSAAPASRYCCGYFDLSTLVPAHVTCQRRRLVPRGVQCSACRVAEGFSSAHRAHLGAELPPHVRAYLDQPHWLYLAIFADGSCKAGTAAESRQNARLAEQGAYAALSIARAADGIAVRRAEADVANHFRLRQAVPAAWKLRAVHRPVEGVALETQLHALADMVTPYVIHYSAADPAIAVPSEPTWWQRPACAAALFERAPLTAYPRDLTLGAHCLFPVALSGSIAAFTTSPPGEGDPLVHVADLAELRGHLLEIDADAPGGATGRKTPA